ncbi:MAG: hypothetical protein NDJ90_10320 [Oligoflexia bacterium]|nr:hypothetical protein [Oligoflexia bacterium]
MKPSELLLKLKSVNFRDLPKKKLALGAGTGLVVILAVTVGLKAGLHVSKAPAPPAKEAVAARAETHEAVAEAPPSGFFGRTWATYRGAWDSVQKTVDRLRKADQQNERLRLENANLRLKLEARQFDCHAADAERATREYEVRLDRETGSRMGRTLASIGYKAPLHLLPGQLYALAASYFKAREDEKAAVLMTFLTGLEDDDTYKTPKSYLMAGIAWYRLDNFVVADNYFDKVLEKADTLESKQLQSQVRLWKGLTAARLGRHDRSQRWLRDVLDQDPHSTEAAWVNSVKEVKRVPAQSHADQE